MNRLMIVAVLAIGGLVACGGDVDEQWDLDHDRIIAVRADKPGLMPGETAELTGLIGHKGAKTEERSPLVVIVPDIPNAPPTPDALKATVHTDSGKWYVTAPDAATLAMLRTQLGLGPTDPVPCTLGISYGETLNAITLVRFGIDAANPVIASPMLDGMPLAADAMPHVGALVDVRLAVTIPDKIELNWLTSVGHMHDFDLAMAYLRVEKDDPIAGELAVVLRDRLGGVTWEVWPITADDPATVTPTK